MKCSSWIVTAFETNVRKKRLFTLHGKGRLMIFDLPEAGGSSSAVGEIDNMHLVLCEF